MAQVRICLSCGTIWKDGTVAYTDGFCLHCPGELGPATDSAQAGEAAWAAKMAATAAAAAKIQPRETSQIDLGALTAARSATPPPAKGVAGATTGPVDVGEFSATTAAVSVDKAAGGGADAAGRGVRTGKPETVPALLPTSGGVLEDDLEPGAVGTVSGALSKVDVPILPPGQSGSQAAAGGYEPRINIEPLTDRNGGGAKGHSSRRHLSAGSGDTTAEVIVGPEGVGEPGGVGRVSPPMQTVSRAATAAAPVVRTEGLPPRLATLTWTCRACAAVYPAGSANIPGKRCSACSEKIQPEIADIPAGTPALVLYDPDTRVRIGRFALTGDVFTIGRLDPGANIFPDLSMGDWLNAEDARLVSRRHCEIIRDRNVVPEVWYLAPSPGNSGVYHRGVLIEAPKRIRLEGLETFGLGGARIFVRFERSVAPERQE